MPVIDRWKNGIATSIKSLDLNAPSYQNAATLESTLKGYIDKVAGYAGTSSSGWAGVVIKEGEIAGRELNLAIPNAGTAAQQQVISQAVSYGAQNGVAVKVTIYP
jgi:filamentous hemagglutinin